MNPLPPRTRNEIDELRFNVLEDTHYELFLGTKVAVFYSHSPFNSLVYRVDHIDVMEKQLRRPG